MFEDNKTIRFTKKFVSGVLKDLVYTDEITYPTPVAYKKFNIYMDAMEAETVVCPCHNGSKYIIIGVEIV